MYEKPVTRKEIKRALKKLTTRLGDLFSTVENVSSEIEDLEIIVSKLRKDLTNA